MGAANRHPRGNCACRNFSKRSIPSTLYSILIFLCKARFMLSPDPEFSQVGATTHVNYLKSFRTYRDTIRREAHTPTYQAILSSFNISLFGRDSNRILTNDAVCRGDGESEDEMEVYHRMLKQNS